MGHSRCGQEHCNLCRSFTVSLASFCFWNRGWFSGSLHTFYGSAFIALYGNVIWRDEGVQALWIIERSVWAFAFGWLVDWLIDWLFSAFQVYLFQKLIFRVIFVKFNSILKSLFIWILFFLFRMAQNAGIFSGEHQPEGQSTRGRIWEILSGRKEGPYETQRNWEWKAQGIIRRKHQCPSKTLGKRQ